MLQVKKFIAVSIKLSLVFAVIGFYGSTSALAGGDSVLGTAGNFQVLSGGDITIDTSATGLDPKNASNSAAAVNDLSNAVTNLLMESGTVIPADLGGKTFGPGSYAAEGGVAFAMTSGMVLDGLNDCDSKFYFKTPAAMNTDAGISITLIKGANVNNIYWVSGAAITIGASNSITGNFLSAAAVTIGASTMVNGRLLGVAAVTVGDSVAFQEFPPTGCPEPAGGISISVPATSETNGISPGETVTVEMGEVVVTDTRGLSSGASWAVSSLCSSMRNESGDLIKGESFSYFVKNLSSTGGLALTTYMLDSMSVSGTVLNVTSGNGINSATWNPVITIAVPKDQPTGTYLGVVTHSVY